MHIYLAKHRGFCFGVRHSLALAEQTYNLYYHPPHVKTCFSLGPLIHNPQVIERLSEKIIPVSSLAELESIATAKDSVLLIRSHGAGPDVFEAASQKGLTVVDATCPLVKKNQLLLSSLGDSGYFTVIVGNADHPEIEALIGWAKGSCLVVDSVEQLHFLPHIPKLAVMAQTTASVKLFGKITGFLKDKTTALKSCPSICSSTAQRQLIVEQLSEKVQLMLVIGGKNSANTQNLYKTCIDNGVPVHLLETADDLDIDILKKIDLIGISAGASTPDWIIEEVVKKMSEIEKNTIEEFPQEETLPASEETPEVVESLEIPAEEQAVPEPVAAADPEPAVAEAAAAQPEIKPEVPVEEAEEKEEKTEEAKRDLFADQLDLNFEALRAGSRVMGTVVLVREGELLVDIGGKSEGILPSTELVREEAENIPQHFAVGDEIEVLIIRRENKEGYPMLSKKRIDQEIVWEKLKEAQNTRTPVTGKIVEVVKGGLLADVGVRGFIPASMVFMGYVEDLHTFVGQTLPMRVEECDKGNNKLILSPKAIMREEAEKKKAVLFASLTAGQTVKGKVRRLATFGAFVDIGGIDGLLHISEMAWYRVNKPSDLLKEGDDIEVYVLGIDPEKEKISLGLKQLVPNPWTLVSEKYPVGHIATAKVMRLCGFGVFVELEPGVEGLVHISQISHKRLNKVEDGVKVGEMVEVKVLAIDMEAKRISLSIKETLPPPEGEAFVMPDEVPGPVVTEAFEEQEEQPEPAPVAVEEEQASQE